MPNTEAFFDLKKTRDVPEDDAYLYSLFGYMDSSYTDGFALDEGFKPIGLVTGLEGRKGENAREVGMAAGETWTQAKSSSKPNGPMSTTRTRWRPPARGRSCGGYPWWRA